MKSETGLRLGFITAVILSIVGAYLKITHQESADTLMKSGFVAIIIFIVMAIYEVVSSKKIDQLEKILWTLALLFCNVIAGIIYFFIGRNRVVA